MKKNDMIYSFLKMRSLLFPSLWQNLFFFIFSFPFPFLNVALIFPKPEVLALPIPVLRSTCGLCLP